MTLCVYWITSPFHAIILKASFSFHKITQKHSNDYLWGRDSSVGKLFASQSGDPGSNPGGGLTGGGLTRVTQGMNERGRDY